MSVTAARSITLGSTRGRESKSHLNANNSRGPRQPKRSTVVEYGQIDVIRLRAWVSPRALCFRFYEAHPTQMSLSQICVRCFDTWVLMNEFEAAIIIFSKEGILEILNLQPRGAKAKPYQVKQVRQVIVRYKMAGKSDEQ